MPSINTTAMVNPRSLYYDILEEEVRFARAVALKAMRPKTFSVWEVLIPIVFILGYMRSRNNREMFVQNFIFTKKAALEGVRDMHAKGLGLSTVRHQLEEKTGELLNKVAKNVYSEAIREAQLTEMDLLLSHYQRLFKIHSGDYATRVVAAYTDFSSYMAFLNQLNQAEKQVADAAIQTIGPDADTAMMTRIENGAVTLRLQNAQRYFDVTE